MTKTETIVNVLCDFIAYVDSFYNEKSGIYPIKGLTNSMVIKGVQSYIAQIGESRSLEWGGGDCSIENEFVTLSSLTTMFSGDKPLILLTFLNQKNFKKVLDLFS